MAPNQNNLSFLIAPPAPPPNCCWVSKILIPNGVLFPISLGEIGKRAPPGGAWAPAWVMPSTTPPLDRPYSAAYPAVTAWNSCTELWGTVTTKFDLSPPRIPPKNGLL